MDIKIIYRDKDILVCEKPAGVPSQPDTSAQPDLLTSLAETNKNIKLVHRLDTPTGGVMVFALTPRAASALCTAVQDHGKFKKEYLAVISGSPEEKEGQLRDFLYHDKRVNKAFAVGSARKGSKEAVLDYRVVCEAGGRSLVLARLHTGRTHQIRVQFASRGYPLVGDGKYGSREKCPFIGLWAYRLTFPHPVSGKNIAVMCAPDTESAPWCDFREAIEKPEEHTVGDLS
jgi:23S rRNA pseudouridine1911/1915/1917 synthase